MKPLTKYLPGTRVRVAPTPSYEGEQLKGKVAVGGEVSSPPARGGGAPLVTMEGLRASCPALTPPQGPCQSENLFPGRFSSFLPSRPDHAVGVCWSAAVAPRTTRAHPWASPEPPARGRRAPRMLLHSKRTRFHPSPRLRARAAPWPRNCRTDGAHASAGKSWEVAQRSGTSRLPWAPWHSSERWRGQGAGGWCAWATSCPRLFTGGGRQAGNPAEVR